jgi:hypothetical protein
VEAGNSAAPLIERATFTKSSVRWRPAYDVSAVDWLLAQLQRPADDPESEATDFDPWRELGMAAKLTGTSRPERQAGRVRGRFANDWAANSGEFEADWDGFAQLPGLQLRMRKVRGSHRTARWRGHALIGTSLHPRGEHHDRDVSGKQYLRHRRASGAAAFLPGVGRRWRSLR